MKKAIGVGEAKLTELKKYFDAGMVDFPHMKSVRAPRGGETEERLKRANAYFQDIYENFAETHAIPKRRSVTPGETSHRASIYAHT